jgi:hypothetical protein
MGDESGYEPLSRHLVGPRLNVTTGVDGAGGKGYRLACALLKFRNQRFAIAGEFFQHAETKTGIEVDGACLEVCAGMQPDDVDASRCQVLECL